MWQEAIQAISEDKQSWLVQNRSKFSSFFEVENTLPQGKLNDAALEAHYKNKLFKMFLGEHYNGLAFALEKGAKTIENATFLNGNWGWLLAIGVGGAYFADYLPEETAQKYFSSKNTLIAGSGSPKGTAKYVVDNWKVSGRWRYCSGSEQASAFTGVCLREGKPLAFIIPQDKGKIIKDWNMIGMPLTCSHSLVLDSVDVEENCFFNLEENPREAAYPISRFPFMLFALICFCPVIFGLFKALLEETKTLLQHAKGQWPAERIQKIECIVFDNRKALEGHSDAFYLVTKECWKAQLSGTKLPENQLLLSGVEAAENCYKMASGLLPLLGMRVLQQEHPVQKIWQNLQTANQHMVFRSNR